MIDLSKIDGIYLCLGKTDMRRGIDSLTMIASCYMPVEKMKHKLFIFCGRDKRTLKILEADYDGFWLYQKKLTNGTFAWPKAKDGQAIIDKRQLAWLLEGLSVIQPKAHKNVNFK